MVCNISNTPNILIYTILDYHKDSGHMWREKQWAIVQPLMLCFSRLF